MAYVFLLGKPVPLHQLNFRKTDYEKSEKNPERRTEKYSRRKCPAMLFLLSPKFTEMLCYTFKYELPATLA
ncbi:hypothetical protein ASE55_11825 [Chryseobacterium sp. Leaf201]|nr:hypothetical protein ASE55_11825 [Chryseobacterium sp. Leaf201]